MREASKRLADSLFQSYENDWAGEEDLGAIVEVGVILCGKHCSFFFFFLLYKYKSSRIIILPGDPNLYPPPPYLNA